MKVTQKPRLHQDWIDPHAYGIVKALQKQGHTTYLVGGCVRDLLVGFHPKDFDIGTTARPNDVKKIIYKSYVIGKRFRLVLVKREDQQYEVATFRRDVRADEATDELPAGDNVFGTPEEDARRRDFTVNGLFYDPINEDLIDYCDGLKDLENHLIRMIGEPDLRLIEDPIRILRALRLSHKLHFSIEEELREGMQKHATALNFSVLPRRREEFLKLLRLEDPSMAFLEAYDLGILKEIAPQLHETFDHSTSGEIFLHHLRHFHDKGIDPQSPLDLFGLLILAYVRAHKQIEPDAPYKGKDFLEDDDILSLMKDQLGMFKHEQSLTARALQLQPVLINRPEFEKKGQRRQLAVLKNEAFPLAMKMTERDFSLSAEDVLFWSSIYEKALPEIEELRQAEKEKRRQGRRGRRRRPSKSRTGS